MFAASLFQTADGQSALKVWGRCGYKAAKPIKPLPTCSPLAKAIPPIPS